MRLFKCQQFFQLRNGPVKKLLLTKTVKQVIKAAKGIHVPDKFILFPIPQQEIDNNDLIAPTDQNPGY